MEKIVIILLIIFIALVITIITLVLISYFKLEVTHYEIKNNKITKDFDGYKILQLSDLHNRNLVKEIVKIVYKEKPDIIVATGDMINDARKGYENFIRLCKALEKCKLVYIYGNHECRYINLGIKKFEKELKNTKVLNLNNEKLMLFEEDSHINLYGLFYDNKYYGTRNKYNVTKEFINEKIGEINNKDFNILLSHDPLKATAYEECGFDLVLSGHIHGGVIGISKTRGLLSPNRNFFPEYSKGINKINDMLMIVSRGLGTNNRIPFRMFNRVEVVCITLKSSK